MYFGFTILITELGKHFKCVFGSPCLPLEQIGITFTNVIAIDPPDALYFSDYVLASYILPNSNIN